MCLHELIMYMYVYVFTVFMYNSVHVHDDCTSKGRRSHHLPCNLMNCVHVLLLRLCAAYAQFMQSLFSPS